jgi:hypothetical protein
LAVSSEKHFRKMLSSFPASFRANAWHVKTLYLCPALLVISGLFFLFVTSKILIFIRYSFRIHLVPHVAHHRRNPGRLLLAVLD